MASVEEVTRTVRHRKREFNRCHEIPSVVSSSPVVWSVRLCSAFVLHTSLHVPTVGRMDQPRKNEEGWDKGREVVR